MVEDAGCFGHGQGLAGTWAAGEGVAREGGDDEVVGESFWGVLLVDYGQDREEFEKASWGF